MKKLASILALTAVIANLGLATAFAQDDTATGTQQIDCGTGPTVPDFSDLTFTTATVSTSAQNTTASQGAFSLTDNRGNDCLTADDVILDVELTQNFLRTTPADNRPLLNGADFTLDVGEAASALSFTMSAPTCSACSDYDQNTSYPVSDSLSVSSNLTPTGPVELFNETSSWSGTASFSGINYTLNIPANALAGVYEATLTYTLTV